MGLCKILEIKNITEELSEKWFKENMWFEFYKAPFYIPSFCDFSDETIRQMREEYDKERIETIWINDVNELFNHKNVLKIKNDKTFPLIRLYTDKNKLLCDRLHNQHIGEFCTTEIGKTSDAMIDLINIKITKDLIKKE